MGMKKAMKRARRGAALLDEISPGWDQQVDLLELDLSDADSCVLGQVFAEQGEKRGVSGYDWARPHYGIDDEFNGFDADDDVKYKHLDRAWTLLITARRAQRDAYATYAVNILAAKLDPYFDGPPPQQILTVADIARDLVDA
jgi:hypothetical protein